MSTPRPCPPALVLASLLALLLAVAAGGCSWLLGVSGDPLVVDLDAESVPDAAPGGGPTLDAAPHPDGAASDAPDDVDVAVKDARAE